MASIDIWVRFLLLHAASINQLLSICVDSNWYFLLIFVANSHIYLLSAPQGSLFDALDHNRVSSSLSLWPFWNFYFYYNVIFLKVFSQLSKPIALVVTCASIGQANLTRQLLGSGIFNSRKFVFLHLRNCVCIWLFFVLFVFTQWAHQSS